MRLARTFFRKRLTLCKQCMGIWISYHKQFVKKGDFCLEPKIVESTIKQLDYLFWFSKSQIVS